MLTFIDGEPLKAGLLLRGPTVFVFDTSDVRNLVILMILFSFLSYIVADTRL